MKHPLPKVNFEKMNGLVPAIVQDARTSQVLMLGYMNEQALAETASRGRVTFFSRSKERLWEKGETSGNTLFVKSITTDCDGDALLILADPQGPTCHLGRTSCFEGSKENALAFLLKLERTIDDRKERRPEGSYTAKLFESGIHRIAQKVGEEAVEVALAATQPDSAALRNEAADLIYHLMVCLRAKGISLTEIVDQLKERHGWLNHGEH